MSKPFISTDQNLSEITVKAVILGVLLSAILAAANAYFGLYAGLTVSASIPAAVISMAVLKIFKKSNILENNLVQTAASAGESLAAGVIFTLPALIIMGYWQTFNYFETVIIAICGGVLGVLFTVPLRNTLIIKEKLTFPEGIATAEVLKSGEKGDRSVKFLVWGSIIGGLFKIGTTALYLWNDVWQKAGFVYQKFYVYFGINLSPALVAVGYIIGLNISFLVFSGGLISWYIAIPAYMMINGVPEGSNPIDMGSSIWSSQVRYLGVGAMVVGGIWALISLGKPLFAALSAGLQVFKKGNETRKNLLRTEKDTPMSWVIIGVGVMIIPIYLIYLTVLGQTEITLMMTLLMIIVGFLFSAVAGYMAGIVGSSNNPISGVTIATVLFASILLVVLIGTENQLEGMAGAILIGAVVCCAAAVAGDNMQDLKAGHILGATPFRQQIMQMIGIVSGAIVLPFVLNSLLIAFGMGVPTETYPNALAAPQATLVQSVAQGIFGDSIPWDMVSIGACIGVGVILLDLYLKSKKSAFRMPILAVAIGIYLPFELDSAIFLGGVLSWILSKSLANTKPTKQTNSGLLLASGLITGEALMGIFIAIAIVFNIQLGNSGSGFLYENMGLLLLGLITFFIYRTVMKAAHHKKMINK